MPATQSVPFCEERKLCPKTLMFIHEEPAWPLPPYCLWVSITAPFIWGHLSGPMNGWGDEQNGGAGEGSCGAVPSPFPAGQAHWDPSILLRENRAPCPHTVPGHRCVPPLLGRWKAPLWVCRRGPHGELGALMKPSWVLSREKSRRAAQTPRCSSSRWFGFPV